MRLSGSQQTHVAVFAPRSGVLAEAGEEVLHAAEHYAKGDLRGAFSDLSLLGKKVMNFDYVKAEGVRAARMSNANVIMWSGYAGRLRFTFAG